jgi:cystathionine beta-lyase
MKTLAVRLTRTLEGKLHRIGGTVLDCVSAAITKQQVLAFVDALELFKIGYSWAGVTSLAVAYDLHSAPNRPEYGARIVRLNIGLEDPDDLKADLARALEAMP